MPKFDQKISLCVSFFQMEGAVEMGFTTMMQNHSQFAQTGTHTFSPAPQAPATPEGNLVRFFECFSSCQDLRLVL